MTRIRLNSLTSIAGTHGPQRGTVKLDIDGYIAIEEADGNGTVDAVFNAILAATRIKINFPDSQLITYQFETTGSDRQTECTVLLRIGERYVTTRASDPDEPVAIAKAICECFNLYHEGRDELPEDVMPAYRSSTYVDASEKKSEVAELISKLDELIEVVASNNRFENQTPNEKETILSQLASARDMLKPKLIAVGCVTAILLPTLYRIGEKLRDAAADKVIEQCLALLHRILL